MTEEGADAKEIERQIEAAWAQHDDPDSSGKNRKDDGVEGQLDKLLSNRPLRRKPKRNR